MSGGRRPSSSAGASSVCSRVSPGVLECDVSNISSSKAQLANPLPNGQTQNQRGSVELPRGGDSGLYSSDFQRRSVRVAVSAIDWSTDKLSQPLSCHVEDLRNKMTRGISGTPEGTGCAPTSRKLPAPALSRIPGNVPMSQHFPARLGLLEEASDHAGVHQLPRGFGVLELKTDQSVSGHNTIGSFLERGPSCHLEGGIGSACALPRGMCSPRCPEQRGSMDIERVLRLLAHAIPENPQGGRTKVDQKETAIRPQAPAVDLNHPATSAWSAGPQERAEGSVSEEANWREKVWGVLRGEVGRGEREEEEREEGGKGEEEEMGSVWHKGGMGRTAPGWGQDVARSDNESVSDYERVGATGSGRGGWSGGQRGVGGRCKEGEFMSRQEREGSCAGEEEGIHLLLPTTVSHGLRKKNLLQAQGLRKRNLLQAFPRAVMSDSVLRGMTLDKSQGAPPPPPPPACSPVTRLWGGSAPGGSFMPRHVALVGEATDDTGEATTSPFAEIEAKQLTTWLTRLAHAISEGNQYESLRLTTLLGPHANTLGTPMQRLTAHVMKALTKRVEGYTVDEYVRESIPFESPQVEAEFRSFSAPLFLFLFGNLLGSFRDALAGERDIHVLDFSCAGGLWPKIIEMLSHEFKRRSAGRRGMERGAERIGWGEGKGGALGKVEKRTTRERGKRAKDAEAGASRGDEDEDKQRKEQEPKLRLRFTAVVAPQGTPRGSGMVLHPSALYSELREACHKHQVDLCFQALCANPDELAPEMIHTEEGEALAVFFSGRLATMRGSRESMQGLGCPKDRALEAMQGLNPRVVLLVEWDCDLQSPAFLPRFLSALEFYAPIFHSLAFLGQRNNLGRRHLEEVLLSLEMGFLLACDPAGLPGKQRGLHSTQRSPCKGSQGFECGPIGRQDKGSLGKELGAGGSTRGSFTSEGGCREHLVMYESLDQLVARMQRLGFAPAPLSWESRILLGDHMPRGFSIGYHLINGCRLLWRGHPGIAASAWKLQNSSPVVGLDFGL